MEKGIRVDSRILEERIQKAVTDGHRSIEIIAHGQHGIGGRLWKAGEESVLIRVLGTAGQRLGSMGFPNTFIDAIGPVSDDVGWLQRRDTHRRSRAMQPMVREMPWPRARFMLPAIPGRAP